MSITESDVDDRSWADRQNACSGINNGRLNLEDNEEASSLRGRNLNSKTPIWQHDRAWIRRPAKFVRSTWLFLTPRSRPKDKEWIFGFAREDESVTDLDATPASLGSFSVACLILNRVIGSGLFSSSSLIFYNTQSIGASLLLWLYGAVWAFSGMVMYIHLGLKLPKLLFDSTKVSVPCNGAEFVYVSSTLRQAIVCQVSSRTPLIHRLLA